MSRIAPAPPAVYAPLFGPDAPLRQQVYAQAPHIAVAYRQFQQTLRDNSELPLRLIELVRLRIAFHNQCRSCMAIRYADSVAAGLTEDLVCSLERPAEADDLTDAEKAAIGYADKMATDHLSITDGTFDELRKYFTEREIMELCFHVGSFVGYGRMGSSIAMIDDLSDEYSDADAIIAPWTAAPQSLA